MIDLGGVFEQVLLREPVHEQDTATNISVLHISMGPGLPSILPSRGNERCIAFPYRDEISVAPVIIILPNDGKIENGQRPLMDRLRSHIHVSQSLESVAASEEFGYDGNDFE